MEVSSFFRGRVAVLATMHRKEAAIAPILEPALGITVTVPSMFNTDRFGTFTRDVQRPDNQLATARLKANAVLEQTGETLAIASEGAFGPHPALPWLPCDRELVVLVDRQHNLEITGEILSLETNFSHATITSPAAANAFAQQVKFPSHGLVIIAGTTTARPKAIIKGITTHEQLANAVDELLPEFGAIHIETDMRAMHNPTRMNVIAQATQALVQKVGQSCPQCHIPGFAVVDYTRGLPCNLCRQPTDQLLATISICQSCGFEAQRQFPDGIETADPAQCNFCNP